jgi:pimeloyl-ACP methyl ester carboxylesterase
LTKAKPPRDNDQKLCDAGTSDKVKALVYVAAFANDPGTNYHDLVKGYADAPRGASIEVDKAGFAHLTAAGMSERFAPDLSKSEQRLMTAMQGPIRGASFGEKVTVAAWMIKPNWYIVAANDQMIPPALEQAMASKIKARTTTVRSRHVPMMSHPKDVADVIVAAATAAN